MLLKSKTVGAFSALQVLESATIRVSGTEEDVEKMDACFREIIPKVTKYKGWKAVGRETLSSYVVSCRYKHGWYGSRVYPTDFLQYEWKKSG